MNNDFIKITGLQVYGHHGVFAEEKEKGQTFVVNAKLYYDMEKAGASDDLSEALNYAEVCEYINGILKEKNFDLLEAAASYVCEKVLIKYECVQKISLELCKPNAPIGLPFENVSVNITRAWHRVFLSIGSNMGDKREYLETAIDKIKKNPLMKQVIVSDLIETEPYGFVEQDSFLNGAVGLYTLMSPQELLTYIHRLEAEAERVRTRRWGPRTLDLDILFYDDLILETEDLIIPHVDMENRDFVLRPLAQIAPALLHPVLNKRVKKLLEDLPQA